MNLKEVLDLSDQKLNELIDFQVGLVNDYCSDYQSIFQLESKLSEKNILRYRDYLITIAGSKYFIASARQRAEAYFLSHQILQPKLKNAKRNDTKIQKGKATKPKPQKRKYPPKKEDKKPKVNYCKRTRASSRD